MLLAALAACHPRVDLLSMPVAPRLLLSCGPCDAHGLRSVSFVTVPAMSEPTSSSEVELGHGVTATCEAGEEGFQIHATVADAQIAALPEVPLDLLGRCRVGEREVVFVVTLDRSEVRGDP